MKFLLAFAVGITLVSASSLSEARSRRGRTAGNVERPRHVRTAGRGDRIAVQPIEGGSAGPAMRAIVSKIVRGRGFQSITEIPHLEGTGLFPSLAKDNRIAAFITGDIEEKGKRSSVTFLVWNGSTGSVVGRWSTSAATGELSQQVGRGFWSHLGRAVRKTWSPDAVSQPVDQGPTMRIDASDGNDEPLALR